MGKTYLLSIVAIMSFVALMFSCGIQGKTYGDLQKLPPMLQPRYNHTSSRFGDDILVAGGTENGYGSLSSCEILDMDSEVWMDGPDLHEGRMRHTANLLENGSILVAGGFSGGGHPSLRRHFNGSGNISLSSCEILHAGASGWKLFPSLETGRFWHSSLNHPKLGLLIIGGLNTTKGALSSCEVFRDGEWKAFPDLPEPLVRFASCILDDGDIFVAGGHDGMVKRSISSCYRFDVDTMSWKEASPMIHPRGFPGYLKISDGRFVVSGGFSEPGSPDRSDAEIYDPSNDSWSGMGDLLFPRHGHGMVGIPGHCLLITGGSNCETGGCHSNLEVYDWEEGKWEDSGHLVMGRKWCCESILQDGTVVITGGRACNYPVADTDIILFDQKRENGEWEIDPVIVVLILISIPLLAVILRKGRI
jgi:hypothetical protein